MIDVRLRSMSINMSARWSSATMLAPELVVPPFSNARFNTSLGTKIPCAVRPYAFSASRLHSISKAAASLSACVAFGSNARIARTKLKR